MSFELTGQTTAGEPRRPLRLAGVQLLVLIGLAIVAVVAVRGCGALRAARARAHLEELAATARVAAGERPVLLVLPGADEMELRSIAARPPLHWARDDRQRGAEIVQANRAALDGILQEDAVVGEEDLAATARLLLVAGRLAVLDGDTDAALRTLEAMSRLARRPAAEVEAVRQRAVLEAHQLALLQDLVAGEELSEQQIERAGASILDIDLRRAFAGAFARQGLATPLPEAPRREGVKGAIVGFLSQDLHRARALESYVDLIEDVQRPWRDLRAELRNTGVDKERRAALTPAGGRVAATESLRTLARAAVELRKAALRTGSYPTSFEPGADPLTGEKIRYTRSASGGAMLMVVGGPQAWARVAVATFFENGPAIWKLAPVTGTRAAPPDRSSPR